MSSLGFAMFQPDKEKLSAVNISVPESTREQFEILVQFCLKSAS